MARQIFFDTTGGPDVLYLREVALRDPAAGEAVLRVDAIGVNRADAMFREGRYFYPPNSPPDSGTRPPGSSKPSDRV